MREVRESPLFCGCAAGRSGLSVVLSGPAATALQAKQSRAEACLTPTGTSAISQHTKALFRYRNRIGGVGRALFFSHIWIKLSVSASVIEGLGTADVFKPLHWHLFAVAQNLCLFVYCKGI